MVDKTVKRDLKNGYTLIELLAVIAIMGIMATLSIASYSAKKKSTALDKAVRELALDLRRVQSMAMNTATFGGVVPLGGYGIYLTTSSPNNNKFIDFADMDGGNDYDGGGEKMTERFFDPNITITSIKVGSTLPPTDTVSALNVNFVPPNPIVKINGNDSWFADVKVQYGSGISKTIKINGITGQTSVVSP